MYRISKGNLQEHHHQVMDPKRLFCGIFLFHVLIAVGTCDSSHMMHRMSLPSTVFFPMEYLKSGSIKPIYFPYENPNPLSSPYLLPKEEADAIPFSLEQLPQILEYFSVPKRSLKAEVILETLRYCFGLPPKGEKRICATSLESFVESVQTKLWGIRTNIQVLSTHLSQKAIDARVQNYTIVKDPEMISTQKMAACHAMRYPYMVLFCHTQEGQNRLYKLSLLGENNGEVEALAICHLDTSQWDADHLAFKALGTKPGESPVCHFLPVNSFALVPTASATY